MDGTLRPAGTLRVGRTSEYEACSALLHVRTNAIPVQRTYRCAICQRESTSWQSIAAPLLTVCDYTDCKAPSLRIVPSWQGRPLIRGSKTVNGERRFVRPEVIQERDGSETVYTSLAQMRGKERERTAHPKIAAANVKGAARRLLPETDAAKYQSAFR